MVPDINMVIMDIIVALLYSFTLPPFWLSGSGLVSLLKFPTNPVPL